MGCAVLYATQTCTLSSRRAKAVGARFAAVFGCGGVGGGEGEEEMVLPVAVARDAV